MLFRSERCGPIEWLRKHDKEWYEKTNARLTTRKKNEKGRLNWNLRDIELSAVAKETVERLIAEQFPRRITKTSIAQQLGVQCFSWLKLRSHLPCLGEYLESVGESQQDLDERLLRVL